MVRQQKNEELMAAGVTLVDPATTYVDVDVEVGQDTVLHPGVRLEGSTRIGAACEVHSGVRLVNAKTLVTPWLLLGALPAALGWLVTR